MLDCLFNRRLVTPAPQENRGVLALRPSVVLRNEHEHEQDFAAGDFVVRCKPLTVSSIKCNCPHFFNTINMVTLLFWVNPTRRRGTKA